jgi:hypothetical protein
MEGRTIEIDGMTIELPDGKPPVEQPKSRSERTKATPADVTDVDPTPTAKAAPASSPAAAEKAAEPVVAKPISHSALRVLKVKMENAGVNESDLKKKFGFDLDAVTTANYNDIVDWLKDPTQ